MTEFKELKSDVPLWRRFAVYENGEIKAAGGMRLSGVTVTVDIDGNCGEPVIRDFLFRGMLNVASDFKGITVVACETAEFGAEYLTRLGFKQMDGSKYGVKSADIVFTGCGK